MGGRTLLGTALNLQEVGGKVERVTSRFTYRRTTGLLLVAPTAAFVLLALVVSVGSGPVPRFDAWVSGIAHACR